MKMYKDTLRKLSPVGIPLAAATLLYTIISGGQNCFGAYTIPTATSAIGVTPVLVYYVFTAVLFAFYGFSFLFKRSASDLYHSLPVTRTDLYLSVTLATATWMGATIVLNVLVMLLFLLIGGCPFVPAYIPLCILFYFVASMLVFAASAIGCALSGSYITALASTGLVLFLPRFVQFILARGLVAKVNIIGWLDLGVLLNPVTNIATGLAVMQTRNMFMTDIVSLPAILYSLAITALELALGAWLFLHRPSETAEKDSGNKAWSMASGCLLAFAALLLITVNSHKLFSVYSAAIIAVALLGFILYEFIALRNVRKVLLSLPLFLLSGVLAFCVSLGIDSLAGNALSVTPAPDEIASVSFRGHDGQMGGTNEYASLLLRDIRFTNDDLKKCVSDNLSAAVEEIKQSQNEDYNDYDGYSAYQVIEPVTIRLTNGKTINRTIEFSNVDSLNDLRNESAEYQSAVRAFPPAGSVQYLALSGNSYTKEERQQIYDSLVDETNRLGLIPNDYYRPQASLLTDSSYNYTRGEDQSLLTLIVAGHVGTKRYSDYYQIRMAAPETASLLMRTQNKYAKADTVSRLAETIKRVASPLALDNDYYSLTFDFFNIPLDDGKPLSTSIGVYVSGYTKKSEDRYAKLYLDYSQKFADILQRGTPTDDVSGMFVRLDWYEYDSTVRETNADIEPDVYLGFSPEDEAALVALIQSWQKDTMYGS